MSNRDELLAFVRATEARIEEEERKLENLRACVRSVERVLAADG